MWHQKVKHMALIVRDQWLPTKDLLGFKHTLLKLLIPFTQLHSSILTVQWASPFNKRYLLFFSWTLLNANIFTPPLPQPFIFEMLFFMCAPIPLPAIFPDHCIVWISSSLSHGGIPFCHAQKKCNNGFKGEGGGVKYLLLTCDYWNGLLLLEQYCTIQIILSCPSYTSDMVNIMI